MCATMCRSRWPPEVRSNDLDLTENEPTFYDALANNKRAVEVMGDEQLAVIACEIIACELIQVMCKKVSTVG